MIKKRTLDHKFFEMKHELFKYERILAHKLQKNDKEEIQMIGSMR